VPSPVVSSPVAVGPGPDALGRDVVVRLGQAPPPGWEGARRVVVDDALAEAPEQLIAMLRQRRERMERTVFELAVDLGAPSTLDHRPPHDIGARANFAIDELHHLVWSNSVDARGAVASFAPVAAACALGARPGGPGDVILPDGTPVWIDAGPLRFRAEVEGVAVVPAITIEHGSLTPFRTNEVPDGVLAPDQSAAVRHAGGGARIIAPAGSGKTRVLTERARHLVHRWGIPSSAISLVAFNRRAQHEMAERTADVAGLQVRTLNGIALAIINGARPFAPRPRAWRTIDEREVRQILGDIVDVPARRNQDPLAVWIEALRAIRLGLAPPRAVEDRFGGDVDGLEDVWRRFSSRLDHAGVVDFDHQIYLALRILLDDPGVREAARRASRVLLVDEFQDLTPAHLLLVRLLAGPAGAVFGVGDDDQTIYGYQGADPGWLIDFAEIFPGAGSHPLEVNYRCPPAVVAGADALLGHNRRRVAKAIRPGPDRTGAAHDLVVVSPSGTTDMAQPGAAQPGTAQLDTAGATVDAVVTALAEGAAPTHIAVLARVNSLLAPVQAELAIRGVPSRGGPGLQLLGRTAVRAVLAWLRLGAGGGAFERRDLAEALRRPSRPLHPNVAEWVTEQRSLDGLERLVGRVRNDRDAERVRAFAGDISRVRRAAANGASTADLVGLIVHDLGVSDAVSTLDHHRRGTNAVAQRDDLVALEQLASRCDDPASFERRLHDLLGRSDDERGVQLSTVHRVKGLEWPYVVVHQADADQFPHRLADDVEEERRVFHVAVTRAVRRAVVVAGVEPSPFIDEMLGRRPVTAVGAGAAPAHRASSSPQRQVGQAKRSGVRSLISKQRGPLADPATVLAVVGLELVDGGTWVVSEVGPDEVVVAQGDARRRFAAGVTVTTAGRQRGRLVVPGPDGPAPATVRAYDLLRQAREALRNGKPAYVVFDDATLERIALTLPTTLSELAAIGGVGPAKLERYGDAVLLAVEDALGE
jgi:DNA helicase II / ATP-dependent DNA helicase PcrA